MVRMNSAFVDTTEVRVLHITPAERAALQLLADGRTKPEIASRLRVDERDVDAWLAALFSRMDCATPVDAVAAAARRGLLRLDATNYSAAATS